MGRFFRYGSRKSYLFFIFFSSFFYFLVTHFWEFPIIYTMEALRTHTWLTLMALLYHVKTYHSAQLPPTSDAQQPSALAEILNFDKSAKQDRNALPNPDGGGCAQNPEYKEYCSKTIKPSDSIVTKAAICRISFVKPRCCICEEVIRKEKKLFENMGQSWEESEEGKKWKREHGKMKEE